MMLGIMLVVKINTCHNLLVAVNHNYLYMSIILLGYVIWHPRPRYYIMWNV